MARTLRSHWVIRGVIQLSQQHILNGSPGLQDQREQGRATWAFETCPRAYLQLHCLWLELGRCTSKKHLQLELHKFAFKLQRMSKSANLICARTVARLIKKRDAKI